MALKIKCESCSGINQLPFGKSIMFCSYCGNVIENTEGNTVETIDVKKNDSNLKTKAKTSRRKNTVICIVFGVICTFVSITSVIVTSSMNVRDTFNYSKLEKGIDITVGNFVQSNSTYYSAIEKAAASGIVYYTSLKNETDRLKKLANRAVNLMAFQKIQLITQSDQRIINTHNNDAIIREFLDQNGLPLNMDDTHYGAQYFLVDRGGANGNELIEVIDAFKSRLINILSTDSNQSNDFLIEQYKKILFTGEKRDQHSPNIVSTFVSRISENQPLASVTANLSIWQAYIRNAEAEVVSSIASELDGNGIVVDKVRGLVQFKSCYVLEGDTVQGEIFLSAYNSQVNPSIYLGQPDTTLFNKGGGQVKFAPGKTREIPIIGEYTRLPISNGQATYSAVANKVGTNTLTGVVEVNNVKGTIYYPYNNSYIVADTTSTAMLTATKMNVLYVDIPNPVLVSAPGVASKDIEVSGLGLSFLTGKKTGEYTVTPSKASGKNGVNVVIKHKKTGVVLGEKNP